MTSLKVLKGRTRTRGGLLTRCLMIFALSHGALVVWTSDAVLLILQLMTRHVIIRRMSLEPQERLSAIGSINNFYLTKTIMFLYLQWENILELSLYTNTWATDHWKIVVLRSWSRVSTGNSSIISLPDYAIDCFEYYLEYKILLQQSGYELLEASCMLFINIPLNLLTHKCNFKWLLLPDILLKRHPKSLEKLKAHWYLQKCFFWWIRI